MKPMVNSKFFSVSFTVEEGKDFLAEQGAPINLTDSIAEMNSTYLEVWIKVNYCGS